MREHYYHSLAELEGQLREMGQLVERAVREAAWALERSETGFARQIVANDTAIDELRYTIETAALNLIARQQPLARDLRTINTMIGTATELERIGDYAEGIARLVLRIDHLAPAEPPPQLPSMAAIAQHMLRDAMAAFVMRDAQAGPRFQLADNEIDDLYSDLSAWVLNRMREQPAAIERMIAYLQTAHNFERIADRTVNIAERTTFIATGVLDAKSNRGDG